RYQHYPCKKARPDRHPGIVNEQFHRDRPRGWISPRQNLLDRSDRLQTQGIDDDGGVVSHPNMRSDRFGHADAYEQRIELNHIGNRITLAQPLTDLNISASDHTMNRSSDL